MTDLVTNLRSIQCARGYDDEISEHPVREQEIPFPMKNIALTISIQHHEGTLFCHDRSLASQGLFEKWPLENRDRNRPHIFHCREVICLWYGNRIWNAEAEVLPDLWDFLATPQFVFKWRSFMIFRSKHISQEWRRITVYGLTGWCRQVTLGHGCCMMTFFIIICTIICLNIRLFLKCKCIVHSGTK